MMGAVAVLTACNKTKINSNRLSGEVWKVVSITTDGEPFEQDDLPELEFEDCDIYDEVCMGHWALEDEEAHFAWQFSDNGELFTLSNQSEMDHDHDHEEDHEEDHDDGHEHMNPTEQCQNFSGSYKVEDSKRKSMKISSSETVGYFGVEVLIELELSE